MFYKSKNVELDISDIPLENTDKQYITYLCQYVTSIHHTISNTKTEIDGEYLENGVQKKIDNGNTENIDNDNTEINKQKTLFKNCVKINLKLLTI